MLRNKVKIILIMFVALMTINSCKKEKEILTDNNNHSVIYQWAPKPDYPFLLPTTDAPFKYAVYKDDFNFLLGQMVSVINGGNHFIISSAENGLIKYGGLNEAEKCALFGTDFPFNIVNISGFSFDDYGYGDDVNFEKDVIDTVSKKCYGMIITTNVEKLSQWVMRESEKGKLVYVVQFDIHVNDETITFYVGVSWTTPPPDPDPK